MTRSTDPSRTDEHTRGGLRAPVATTNTDSRVRTAFAGNSRRFPSLLACIAVGGLAGPMVGCSSVGLGLDREAPQRVEPSDFATVPEGRPGVDLAAQPSGARSAQNFGDGAGDQADADSGSGSGRTTTPTFRVVPGAPVTLADAAAPVEQPLLLDGKVGDINGRPIFASAFFEPIEGRLRAEAAEMNRDAWLRSAAGIIQDELRGQITDELLRAEALSKLSVEEKAGLRRFLEGVRTNLLSRNLGSRQLAARRLQREQGLTEEEYLKQREERALVRFTVQQEISDRINVSWRDIVRRYQRDAEIYNPDPIARYRLIRIDSGDDGGRAQVEAALAGGTIIDIAESDLNTWTVDPGGLREVDAAGGLESVSLLNSEEINAAARSLAPGGTAGPIELGSSLMWVHLEGVESETVELYDAQLPIAEQIRSERTNRELQRYIDRLLGRASVTDIDRMLVRLLGIAADRYAPAPTLPGRQ